MATFLRFDVPKVGVEFWYLDSGDTVRTEYTRDEVPEITAVWEERFGAMMSSDLEPTPGSVCRKYGTVCPYSSAKGGPCPY